MCVVVQAHACRGVIDLSDICKLRSERRLMFRRQKKLLSGDIKRHEVGQLRERAPDLPICGQRRDRLVLEERKVRVIAWMLARATAGRELVALNFVLDVRAVRWCLIGRLRSQGVGTIRRWRCRMYRWRTHYRSGEQAEETSKDPHRCTSNRERSLR